jgi:hypothetical protein
LPGGGNERYVDAQGKRSFAFDHVALVRHLVEAEGSRNSSVVADILQAVSEFEPYELPDEESKFRWVEVAQLAYHS